MIELAEQLGQVVGVSQACESLTVPRSSLYQARQPQAPAPSRPNPQQGLSPAEKEKVRETLNSERFQDSPPRQVYATLLDEDQVYLCHWRTMYRILKEQGEVRERRNQLRHPRAVKPELVATGSNQLWSWDITKLRGPAKWHFYYLYVILDVYSRYVVGWLIAEQESARLAEQLIAESCRKQGIEQDQLVLHADRGSPMKAKSVAQLLADLRVTKSHSRPHVPNDNPYSEAQFKTMKYQPDFPDRFGTLDQAREWGRRFFAWYNDQFYHSSLGLLTPATVHYGRTEQVLDQRQAVLEAAYAAHPERFVKGRPTVIAPPKEVWINKPQTTDQTILLPTDELTLDLGLRAPASSASASQQPGAQPGSRVPANGQAQRSLDAGEHLANLGQTLDAGALDGQTRQ